MAKRATKQKTKPAAAAKASAVKKAAKPVKRKKVEAISHAVTASRRNIPTAEYQDAAENQEAMDPRGPVTYARARPLAQGERRPRDGDKDPQIVWNGMRVTLKPDQVRELIEKDRQGKPASIEIGDAQLVWRGKDEQDWSDLVVNAPPLYIQEKIHPKAIIDDLVRHSNDKAEAETDAPTLFGDLFADFNGLNDPQDRTEFYQHSQHWSNRMILGDSLQVMASLAEREGLRGHVQCIYFDPPYGIKFNSNWQVSTQSRTVKDGKQGDISREPEQVKAFRDTWVDGIHSYLTYLRDRLSVARDLLSDSGAIFVQIGDQNAHRVRAVLDEVFGEDNHVNDIVFKKKSSTSTMESVFDTIIWYAKDKSRLKIRNLYDQRNDPAEEDKFNTLVTEPMQFHNTSKLSEERIAELLSCGARWARVNYPIVSQDPSDTRSIDFEFRNRTKSCGVNNHWRFSPDVGLPRLAKAGRLFDGGGVSLGGVVFWDDWNQVGRSNIWDDVHGEKNPTYVVQTAIVPIQRCVLMTSDPGDLVLDPTCGSGTTALVAEQWGRRWITIDTSRVALALARARLVGARFHYYFLSDSKEGRNKEQEVIGKMQADTPVTGDVRLGFVYDRVPHVTLSTVADSQAVDEIWDKFKGALELIRAELNKALRNSWDDWDVPREPDTKWPDAAKKLHASWWETCIQRQREIDEAIKKGSSTEYLYDRPFVDTTKVRVTGPFTVESLSPHRVVPSGDDEMAEELKALAGKRRRTRLATPPADFTAMVLEHLKTSGVQQVEKKNKITFDSIAGRATKRGEYIGAEAIYLEGGHQRRAAILIGPEYGSLTKADLLAAAQEAANQRFDVLVACAFSFDAHAAELSKLGPLTILKAKMNPDLHMAGELKNTGKGNLFVVFGEPDIDILEQDGDRLAVKINGIDVFDPNTGDIRSGDTKSIAAWFIDTDYNEESFFVRHAYFLGANDPYKSLKAALRAEIDEEAWATLYRDTSRPFTRPKRGVIAVKVINHFGDEVMKVYRL